jgi:hypothetical protein|tara:strand:+ start:36 stop:785 length:750 start_codon:yes stop_codon:yes gene_type:complete
MAEQQFPSEMVDLPSGGKLYPEDSPLSSGKIEIKYMTAKEEDILTSQNLIKKGVVIEKLLDSLILTEGVKSSDLIIGDKNAIMVASRILAYGPEYTCEIEHPITGNIMEHTFNLADCPFKKIPKDVKGNEFEIELPISKVKIKYKLLTGADEKSIESEIKAMKKMGSSITKELTTRLRHLITSVDGDDKQSTINIFAENMLSRDSLEFRKKISELSPDIDLSQEIDIEGEAVKVDIPMTANFFWPDSNP